MRQVSKKNYQLARSKRLSVMSGWVRKSLLALAALLLTTAQVQAETYYFHNDQLGTPQVLTDSTQQVVWKGEYDPFGGCTEVVNLVQQNIRFPGQYFDQETGLHYNYHRSYDPNTGRYIESDPIGLGGGLSTYGYAYQNSVGYKDPTGELAWGVVFAGVNLAYQMAKNKGDLSCVNWVDVGLSAIGGGLVGKALKKVPGKEWSHWIPDRYVRPRSLSGKNPNPYYKPRLDKYFGGFVRSKGNGNYVSPKFHSATDPFRNIRGTTKADTLNPFISLPLRTPGWIPGLGITATTGLTKDKCNNRCK